METIHFIWSDTKKERKIRYLKIRDIIRKKETNPRGEEIIIFFLTKKNRKTIWFFSKHFTSKLV